MLDNNPRGWAKRTVLHLLEQTDNTHQKTPKPKNSSQAPQKPAATTPPGPAPPRWLKQRGLRRYHRVHTPHGLRGGTAIPKHDAHINMLGKNTASGRVEQTPSCLLPAPLGWERSQGRRSAAPHKPSPSLFRARAQNPPADTSPPRPGQTQLREHAPAGAAGCFCKAGGKQSPGDAGRKAHHSVPVPNRAPFVPDLGARR